MNHCGVGIVSIEKPVVHWVRVFAVFLGYKMRTRTDTQASSHERVANSSPGDQLTVENKFSAL